ncbi:MAG: hypothetical protein U0P30_08740 [Vicinamibacterales bacterium]
MTTPDTARWRTLLLDSLDDDARAALEARMFLEPGLDDAIAIAEDDLIADYVDGRLAAPERTRFERVYLSSAPHRARVDIVRLLRQRSNTRTPAQRPWWLAVAAAAVLALAVGALLLRQPPEPRTASSATRPAPVPPTPSAASPIVATLVLTPPVTRGNGAMPTLKRPADATTIRLEAPFVRDAVGATIEAIDAADAMRADTRPLAPTGVAIDVEARRLPAGDYTITFVDDQGRAVARTAFRVE